ncbi:MAG: outer membrane beta-barrel protein [bacterium]
MNFRRMVLLALLSFLLLGDCARAQEDPEKCSQRGQVEFKYYLQGSYEANSNNPQSGRNDFRAFDMKANFLSFDLAQIVLSHEAQPSSFGFRLKLSGGEYAKLIHARSLGNPDESFDLTEAFVVYAFQGKKGPKMAAGKMLTFVGAEVLEAVDDPNFSRSLLYTYAEPLTQTGVRLGYDFSDKLSGTAYIINGWDNFADNNSAKTLGLCIGYNPSEKAGMCFNFLSGPERDNNEIDNRFLFDWVGTFKPAKNLTFLLNYDIGTEKNATTTGSDAKWEGYSIIGKYDFSDRFNLAIRGEDFHDYDGFRSGTPQTLRELTFSATMKMGKHVYLRPEYRYDWSDAKAFNNGAANNQSTVGLGLMLAW